LFTYTCPQYLKSMGTIAASELAKLVGKASEAAAKAVDEGDAAAQTRCLDVLKVLAGANVTAAVLKETDAGKRINRLTKSTNEQVAAAATQVVQAWKACVKKQAEASGLQPSSSLPGVSSARSLSLPADNNGSGQEASTRQPAPQQQRSGTPGGSGGSAGKPPPKAGDSKRDKVRWVYCAHTSAGSPAVLACMQECCPMTST
jgi:transcription elongation factor S-II